MISLLLWMGDPDIGHLRGPMPIMILVIIDLSTYVDMQIYVDM